MLYQAYSNPAFNRAPSVRDMPDTPEAGDLVLGVRNDRLFFEKKGEDVALKTFSVDELKHLSESVYFLGKNEGTKQWCMDLTDTRPADLTCLGDGEFEDVRKVFTGLDGQSAALAAYARGMVSWNRLQQYCGACGAKTYRQQWGHSRKCRDLACSRVYYPQIAPAVIVLIERKTPQGIPLCLLNKVPTDSGVGCSTFAGFVEVGESLEDAVIREMKEEVDVDVFNIRYVASQAWPFSSALMVGFVAETDKACFQVDGDEIKDAAWFTAEEIRRKVANGKLVLSKPDSIARYLMESWATNTLNKS